MTLTVEEEFLKDEKFWALEAKRRAEAEEFRRLANVEKEKADAIIGITKDDERRRNNLTRSWLRLLSLSLRATFQADFLHTEQWKDVASTKLAQLMENAGLTP